MRDVWRGSVREGRVWVRHFERGKVRGEVVRERQSRMRERQLGIVMSGK